MIERGKLHIIIRLKKMVEFWRFYGIKGFLYKCWEKAVIDPRRYSSGHGKVPDLYSFNGKSTPAPKIKAAKPMEIWYLIHFFFPEKKGGTERFVLNMAQTQQSFGHQVRVITFEMKPIKAYDQYTDGILWREYDVQGVSVIAIRYRHTPVGLYYKRIDEDDPALTAFTHMLFAKKRPDVVHCAYGQPMAAFLKVCRQQNIPYLMTLTDFNSLCHYTTMIDTKGCFCSGSKRGHQCQKICRTYGIKDYSERWKQAERYLFGAAYVTVPSEFVAKVVGTDFDGLSTIVIPHGVSLPLRGQVQHGPIQRFAYVGTLTEMKGIPLLLRAFQFLPEDCSLDVYGEGNAEYTAHLQQLSAHDARIRFQGSLPPKKIWEAYASSDCVVIPSLWPETYNFVLREALQSGCLVVAARIGAMSEAIKEGENGFLFTPGDQGDLLRVLYTSLEFDWTKYKRSYFPSVKEEGRQYENLYIHSILQQSE